MAFLFHLLDLVWIKRAVKSSVITYDKLRGTDETDETGNSRQSVGTTALPALFTNECEPDFLPYASCLNRARSSRKKKWSRGWVSCWQTSIDTEQGKVPGPLRPLWVNTLWGHTKSHALAYTCCSERATRAGTNRHTDTKRRTVRCHVWGGNRDIFFLIRVFLPKNCCRTHTELCEEKE